ncbi:MAG: ScyD/ScyE family protein [Bryobacteraceae bacterium]
MNTNRLSIFKGIATMLTVAAALAPFRAMAQSPATFTVYATGLNGPRGLEFGPDGTLYVAEAGTAGTNSTVGQCPQVGAPAGPYVAGRTARILKVTKSGTLTPVAGGFPSGQNGFGDIQGVADIAFLQGQMYALVAGGGCSHGDATIPAGIAKVDLTTGNWTMIANLSTFLQQHPARYISPGDWEADGSFYSMVATNGLLYAVEPNHGQIVSISPRGGVDLVMDVSSSEGHIVPTAIESSRGNFYVGNLGGFPIAPGTQKILALAKQRGYFGLAPGFDVENDRVRIVDSRAGFTTVVSIKMGPDGLLYVLELSSAAGFPSPGAGKVVRLRWSGEIEDVVTGLVVPTAMTFGPDGALYISNFGAAPAGAGQILRFSIPHAF